MISTRTKSTSVANMLDFDPLPTLRKLHRYPISLLAMLADHRGVVSGSQSLETFVPGHGIGPNSDFDIYQPRNPDAIMDVMHTLQIAGIRWKITSLKFSTTLISTIARSSHTKRFIAWHRNYAYIRRTSKHISKFGLAAAETVISLRKALPQLWKVCTTTNRITYYRKIAIRLVSKQES
jgi:hypothetical protein